MNEPNLIKRKSFTEKIMEKQKVIFTVAVCLIITLFIGTSYSLLTNFNISNNAIIIKDGDMRMTINEANIKLVSENPISDYQGMRKSDTTVLTLSNTGNVNITKYEVKLEADKNSNLSLADIRYSYSTDFGVHYSNPMSLSNNIIYTGYNLLNNKSKTLYIKIWIDEQAINTSGKEFYGKISVKLSKESNIPYGTTVVKGTNDVELIDNNYYYNNSNNYVMFNHELWRIVCVYSNESGIGKLRIVRNDVFEKEMIPDKYVVDEETYTINSEDGKISWNSAFNSYLNEAVDGHGSRGYLGYISNEARSMIDSEFTLLNTKDIKGDWFKELDKTNWITNDNGEFLILNQGEIETPSNSLSYIRVTVDLNPRVVITSGDGTLDNPYLLSI